MLTYNYLPHYEYDLNKLWDRFWVKVTPTGFCWEWDAYKDKMGYGLITLKNNPKGKGALTGLAHRVSYLLLVGEFDRELHLDHLCRNHSCVNPDHLDPVTREENTARGHGSSGLSRKKLCAKGHSVTGDNAVYRIDTGTFRCGICQYENTRKKHIRKVAKEKNVSVEAAEGIVRKIGSYRLGGGGRHIDGPSIGDKAA